MTPVIHPVLVTRPDPARIAILDEVEPLRYAGGAWAAQDVPSHVRAASAMGRSAGRLVIVQDDVNALAMRDDSGQIVPVLLPAGPGGRRVFDEVIGNKKDKMDLEACITLPDGRLLAFGSGSTSARERVVVLPPRGQPRVVPAASLYDGLRSEPAFSGSELNVEGAVLAKHEVLLLQRGNGAARGQLLPVNAIGTLDLDAVLAWLDHGAPAPRLTSVTQVDLGTVGGSMLGFTDAALTADGRLAILACAEDSPDAVRDGPVLGCRFGLLEGDVLRLIDIVDEHGRPTPLKLEGIQTRPGPDLDFDVVADMDAPTAPATLGRLRIRPAGR